MNRAKLAFSTAAGLLAGCSSLIPPQTVPNPIGLSGRQVQVEIGAAGVSAATVNGLGIVRASFADIDTSSIPISFSLSQSLFKVGFAAETKLNTTAASLPCAIILTKVDIIVTLKDDLKTITLPAFRVNKVVTLEQQAEPTTYKIANTDVFVGNVLSNAEVKGLQDIITTGGNNQAEARVIVQGTSVPELPPGSVLTFTFAVSEATLRF